ncbi:hypothetical protein ACVWWG_000307 [Bradyrhizobium sp. LB7.2]
MDPARTFKESLTSRPELENSQGQKRPSRRARLDVRITGKSGRCIHLNAVRLRAKSGPRRETLMCGVFAEFERGMIRERVNAGLARTRAKARSSVDAR